jgi:FemAB-related protein (PEP-CTERM system-associated)
MNTSVEAPERSETIATGTDAGTGAGTPVLRLLQPADRARWDTFVGHCPEGTFFHRAGWQQVLEQAFGHRCWFYYAEQDGAIVGVLPLCEIRSRLFGHTLMSLPFCVYGGIAATSAAARALLDQAAQALAVQLGVGHLEYRNLHPAPLRSGWQEKPLYVTFRKAIVADDEANMNAIPRKQRAMVRKGIKCGLVGEVDSDARRFFAAYARSVHRLGTPVFPRRYFDLLKKVFGDDCEIRTIVHPDGRIVAGVLSFFFRDEVLPYYGGGTDLAREVAGNDFMYWDLMRSAAARGCRLFDFGRSKLGTGAYDFKHNWGFEARPLPYQYQLHGAAGLPDVNPLNPKYSRFIKLWRAMPLPLANALGPHIVRNLG